MCWRRGWVDIGTLGEEREGMYACGELLPPVENLMF